ncbi:unnamed protein product [Lymnaea stagnalis]|uniref:Xaa-Pro aminopeptidase P n=1 Tax=Lymnaea stagnalis TaxID=6523 RepID=A0AAV2HE44_LYMST
MRLRTTSRNRVMGRETPSLFALLLLTVHQKQIFGSSLAERLNCGPGDAAPHTRVNTTQRLQAFRAALASVRVDSRPLSAFIVGSADAHNSEYPTAYDQRRGYISGFQGSAGTAVITATKAALWTDGRYFLEAEDTLDCNWILMKSGLSSTPSITDWLNSELTTAGELVGVDKSLTSHASFVSTRDTLKGLSKRAELTAVDSTDNPVDKTWTEGRPTQPTGTINALELKFAGVRWQEKIINLRSNLTAKNAGAFVVTSLDELAWLFNLRGTDIDYNPFFLGYAIVELNRIRFYVLNKDTRLTSQPTDPATTTTFSSHLGTRSDGSCEGMTALCVEVRNYNQTSLEHDLRVLASTTNVWITHEASYGIYAAVENNRTTDRSPIALDKSRKNPVERAGMQTSYNRDSAALIRFLAFLEREIKEGRHWTEVSAARELDKRRRQLDYNRGLSFDTISGYGSNGAIIHYRPSNATDKKIATDSLYLLDSGGQYLDGTTDTTRTLHYGTPTSYQKECYTRVLMSAINLATLRWPSGLYGSQIDALARYQLWDVGLVYRHGTGHGVGAYLSVHEGPGRISMLGLSRSPSEEPLTTFQYYSDEPGYYEDGSFGVRLETVLTVEPFTSKYNTSGEEFLQFTPVALVPFEVSLIDFSLLNRQQVAWLNFYNSKIRVTILPLLSGDQLATDWLNARTQPFSTLEAGPNTANGHSASQGIMAALALVLIVTFIS